MENKKKLYRSNDDKIISGVTGGLAEYFGVDSTKLRLLVFVVMLVSQIGLPLYLGAWFIIPKKPENE